MNTDRYLFRGKRIDNGEWVYGSLMQTIDPTKVENVYHMAHIYEGVNISAPVKVIPETVGQFTGLTDKNGVKIFEGDKIHVCPGYCSLVEFKDGMFVSVYSHPEDGETLPLFEIICLTMEVIGSIHDNN